MLFTPPNERLWDTWLVHHEGVYHLFYLRIAGSGGWDGISVATSRDLVHFDHVGPLVEKLPTSNWLGTGAVWWADGRWVMNFSEEEPGTPPSQVIRFAESDRLTGGWRRIEGVTFVPDPRWYEHSAMRIAEPTPRWDSIAATHLPERGERPWLGFFTANALEAPRGASGCVGMAESADGVHWEALPPPLEPGLFANCEVVEHCRFADRHYLLFTSNSAAGIRFDGRTPGNAGGTWYVVGDAADGPYHLPPGDPLLQGTRGDDNIFATVVGRPFRHPDGSLLYSHHWAHHQHAPNGSWGPIKRLIESRPWQLALAWWEGNEALKDEVLGAGVAADELTPMAAIGLAPVVEWSLADGVVEARHDGGCAVATWDPPAATMPAATNGTAGGLGDGRVLETVVRIERGTALGPWIGTTPRPGTIAGPAPGMGPRLSDHRLAVLLDADRQQVLFVRLMRSLGPSLVVEATLGAVPWPIGRGISHRLRLLVRGHCLECYCDDRYVHGILLPEPFAPQRLGFACDRADGHFTDTMLWRMG